jgi:hypothetical protein
VPGVGGASTAVRAFHPMRVRAHAPQRLHMHRRQGKLPRCPAGIRWCAASVHPSLWVSACLPVPLPACPRCAALCAEPGCCCTPADKFPCGVCQKPVCKWELSNQ